MNRFIKKKIFGTVAIMAFVAILPMYTNAASLSGDNSWYGADSWTDNSWSGNDSWTDNSWSGSDSWTDNSWSGSDSWTDNSWSGSDSWTDNSWSGSDSWTNNSWSGSDSWTDNSWSGSNNNATAIATASSNSFSRFFTPIRINLSLRGGNGGNGGYGGGNNGGGSSSVTYEAPVYEAPTYEAPVYNPPIYPVYYPPVQPAPVASQPINIVNNNVNNNINTNTNSTPVSVAPIVYNPPIVVPPVETSDLQCAVYATNSTGAGSKVTLSWATIGGDNTNVYCTSNVLANTYVSSIGTKAIYPNANTMCYVTVRKSSTGESKTCSVSVPVNNTYVPPTYSYNYGSVILSNVPYTGASDYVYPLFLSTIVLTAGYVLYSRRRLFLTLIK